jgi:hypothetical protein
MGSESWTRVDIHLAAQQVFNRLEASKNRHLRSARPCRMQDRQYQNVSEITVSAI